MGKEILGVCRRVLIFRLDAVLWCNYLPDSSVHGVVWRQLCLQLSWRTPLGSPGKSTGVGCHTLLQGIFPTQGLNRGLLHCRQIPYH